MHTVLDLEFKKGKPYLFLNSCSIMHMVISRNLTEDLNSVFNMILLVVKNELKYYIRADSLKSFFLWEIYLVD